MSQIVHIPTWLKRYPIQQKDYMEFIPACSNPLIRLQSEQGDIMQYLICGMSDHIAFYLLTDCTKFFLKLISHSHIPFALVNQHDLL